MEILSAAMLVHVCEILFGHFSDIDYYGHTLCTPHILLWELNTIMVIRIMVQSLVALALVL